MAYYKCGRVYTTQNSNVVVDTASGAVANFQTPLAMPLLKTRFDFKATQDLHGQSGAYPAGGGINKWDEETVNGYLSSTDGSFISHNTSICSKNFNTIEPSTDYFLFKGSSTPTTYVCLYDANYDFIKREAVAGVKVTTPSNAAYFKISCYGYGATYKNDISINYPSTDTAYHPYSNICPISGRSAVNVIHRGGNLWNEQWEVGSIDTTTGLNIADNTRIRNKDYIAVKPNTAVYVVNGGLGNIRMFFYDKNKNYINSEGWKTGNAVQNIPNNICYIKFMLATQYGTTYNNDISLNYPSSDTDYHAYNGSTTLINLGGTYYGGYVSQDKDGKRDITVTKGITTLGDLTNWRYAQGSGVWRFQAKMPNDYKLPETISERLDFISSCFKPDLSPTTGGSVDNSIAGYTNDTKVYILCNKYTDLDTFLTDLSSQTLVYPLAEPFTVALPDRQPIKSLPGVNNIFADTGDTSLQFAKIGN